MGWILGGIGKGISPWVTTPHNLATHGIFCDMVVAIAVLDVAFKNNPYNAIVTVVV